MSSKSARERPSHSDEDVNERIVPPNPDYPVEVDEPEQMQYTVPVLESTPVYLTEAPPSTGRGIVQWEAASYTLDSNGRQLLADNDRERTKCVVKNTHATDSVWLSCRENTSAFMAYELQSGQEATFTHTGEIWAFAGANATAFTAYWEFELR